MAPTRIPLPLNQLIGPSSLRLTSPASFSCCYQVRTYAAKAAAPKAGSGGKKVTTSRGSKPGSDAGDSRVEAVKKALLESDPTDEARLSALKTAVPSLEAHDTITRAWSLHSRLAREQHTSELNRKYTSLVSALELLKETDVGLWEKATKGVERSGGDNRRLGGLVPREYQGPMDLGARWDSEWKAPGSAPAPTNEASAKK